MDTTPPRKRCMVASSIYTYKIEIFAELDEEEMGGIAFGSFLRAMDPDRTKSEKKDTIRRIYRKYDK